MGWWLWGVGVRGFCEGVAGGNGDDPSQTSPHGDPHGGRGTGFGGDSDGGEGGHRGEAQGRVRRHGGHIDTTRR